MRLPLRPLLLASALACACAAYAEDRRVIVFDAPAELPTVPPKATESQPRASERERRQIKVQDVRQRQWGVLNRQVLSIGCVTPPGQSSSC